MSVIPEAPAPAVLDLLRNELGRCNATHVLEIGTGRGNAALAIARMLPASGMLVTIERDRNSALFARDRFAAAGVAHKVSVMVGDASRYLHKLAGPFDVIFQDGDPALYEAMLDRLVTLLRPSGVLVTNNVTRAGDYNKRLDADSRLRSAFVSAGNDVAISIKLENSAGSEHHRRATPEATNRPPN